MTRRGDAFSEEIGQVLATRFGESELRALCARLRLDYDRLDGQTKKEKATALVSLLRHTGRVHTLLAERPELKRDVSAGSRRAVSAEGSDALSSDLAKRAERRRRREERLAPRKRFLRAFFRGSPVALEDELCTKWEFEVTRALYRFWPGRVARGITHVASEFAELTFAQENRPQPSSVSPTASSDEKHEGISLSSIDKSFVNYHSVRHWYRPIRSFAQLVLLELGILLCIVLSVPLAYLAGVSFLLGGLPFPDTQGNPGLVYTVSQPGQYHLEVRDTAAPEQEYVLSVTHSPSDLVAPDFSQADVWPVRPGEEVFARVTYGQSHLYRIEGVSEGTVFVTPYRWYADADLEFSLFARTMDACASVRLLATDLAGDMPFLECSTISTGPYYLQVRLVNAASSTRAWSSRYGFGVSAMVDLAAVTSNDSLETSVEMPRDAFVLSSLGSSGREYYHFIAQEGEQLRISTAGLSDCPLSSLTLYRLSESGPVVVAYSDRPLPVDVGGEHSLLETSYGRALFASGLLQTLGFDAQPTSLPIVVWDTLVLYSAIVPILSLAMFAAISRFVLALSRDVYQDSLVVAHLIRVLHNLRDDDVLNSADKKAALRASIHLVADRTTQVHRSGGVTYAAPKDLEMLLVKIASQVRQMDAVLSSPGAGTLNLLRSRFSEWLDVFLRGEYGRFRFEESFETTAVPWYRAFISYLRRHFWSVMLVSLAVLVLSLLTRPLWQVYTYEILTLSWLALRYLLLIVCTYAIYSRWGVKGPSEKPASKWEHAVRLILFFFVPLFGLDIVLGTGLVENILALVNGIRAVF